MFWKRKKTLQNFANSSHYQFPASKISIVVGDYDQEVKIQRCRNYLESTTLEVLVQELKRATNFIESRYKEVVIGNDRNKPLFIMDFVFPDSVNSKIGHEVDAFDYRIMAEKIIEERSEREKVRAS